MFNWANCDRKSQLSGIWTEPLNPRGQADQVVNHYSFKLVLI